MEAQRAGPGGLETCMEECDSAYLSLGPPPAVAGLTDCRGVGRAIGQ